jgi:plasmid stabilization system protein ParE
LDRLFSDIARDNPQAADRVARAIVNAAESLPLYPKRYAERPEGFRQMPVFSTPYVLRYVVKTDARGKPCVLIMSVRHGAQDG